MQNIHAHYTNTNFYPCRKVMLTGATPLRHVPTNGKSCFACIIAQTCSLIVVQGLSATDTSSSRYFIRQGSYFSAIIVPFAIVCTPQSLPFLWLQTGSIRTVRSVSPYTSRKKSCVPEGIDGRQRTNIESSSSTSPFRILVQTQWLVPVL